MSELRTLAIQIPEPMYAALVRKARGAGMTPAVYARCLLDAAYSVRVGAETQDRELAAAVSRVFARPPSPGKGEARGDHEDRDETPHPRASRATSPARGEVKKEGGTAPVVHLVAERPLAPQTMRALAAMVTAAAAAMTTVHETAIPADSPAGSPCEGPEGDHRDAHVPGAKPDAVASASGTPHPTASPSTSPAGGEVKEVFIRDAAPATSPFETAATRPPQGEVASGASPHPEEAPQAPSRRMRKDEATPLPPPSSIRAIRGYAAAGWTAREIARATGCEIDVVKRVMADRSKGR